MTDINFTSTYRIPITQAGVNSAKKAKLKELVESYPNGLIGKSKVGNARVSIPNSEDAKFIGKLKSIGYKIFQKFEGEDIPKEKLDIYIKENLDARTFAQKGKSPERFRREIREKRRYERNFTPSKFDEAKEAAKEETKEVAKEISTPVTKPAQKVSTPKKDISESKKAEIRLSDSYIELKNAYGEDFAEAVFFNLKK